MLTVAIYIQDAYTLQYNRVDLFDDEKISVVSSIQNINDISKTYTDFSQTFTVPASKQNNKIFRHWYDNSNDSPFSTLVKSDAFIEIDTIPFRKGKIQLESANLENGQAKDYSITFIGILGNLKDTFAGLYLKDLKLDENFDFLYSGNIVVQKITTLTPTTPATPDISFPLISSSRYWNYGKAGSNDISLNSSPIRFDELFPAIRLSAVISMIETQFGINFAGTSTEPSTFLNTDARFLNAYLYLKNTENFQNLSQNIPFKYTASFPQTGTQNYFTFNVLEGSVTTTSLQNEFTRKLTLNISFNSTVAYINMTIILWKNGVIYRTVTGQSTSSGNFYTLLLNSDNEGDATFYVTITTDDDLQISAAQFSVTSDYSLGTTYTGYLRNFDYANGQLIRNGDKLLIYQYFPEIKIEDFFSGLLKMFNLTCYSEDGINYTIEQLESYYGAGSDVDITKYILQDKKNLNRVKTYKRINFEYEKSESITNFNFNYKNGIEYGSLYYTNIPKTEGEEYSIKLPFEDLNFQNLRDKLQVGYALKNDAITKYIPKPIILYDYTPTALTNLVGVTFYLSNATSGFGTGYTSYKAFGQETLISTIPYSLNFPTQQSTLTNVSVTKGLYDQYYSAYFANIFNYKARLVKVSAILPTSILTSLKLNDNVIIRDAKYLINTFTTDLTTGEVQFELLTDQRI